MIERKGSPRPLAPPQLPPRGEYPVPCPRSPRESRGAEVPRPGSTPPCPADATHRPRSPCRPIGAEIRTESRRGGRGRPLPPGGREAPASGRATREPAHSRAPLFPLLALHSAASPHLVLPGSRSSPLCLEAPPRSLALQSQFPTCQCPLCPTWNFTLTPHPNPSTGNLASQLRSFGFLSPENGSWEED